MVLAIRRLRPDERGVASTVGTVMALLVFLTFFSLIINQWVPVWMKDSESAHMAGALGQFEGIKGSIDFQVLSSQMALSSGSLFLPTTTSTAVTLGLDGFPIFSGPTPGVLTSTPDAPPTAPMGSSFTVFFVYSLQGIPTPVWQNSSGLIDLNVANRYFTPQHIVYENGAVIRAQSDGQIVRGEPLFDLTKSAANVSFAFELVSLYGAGSVSGTTTEIVSTKVFAVNQQTYQGILGQGIWINETSPYGLAWYNFANATLSKTFGIAGTFTRTSTSMLFATAFYSVRLAFNPLANTYGFALFLKNGPLTPTFTLQQAWVNIGVGEQSNLGA
jgi:hypothetical protein